MAPMCSLQLFQGGELEKTHVGQTELLNIISFFNELLFWYIFESCYIRIRHWPSFFIGHHSSSMLRCIFTIMKQAKTIGVRQVHYKIEKVGKLIIACKSSLK